MPNIYPGALWRPMPGSSTRPKRRKGRGVAYHIAVSERPSIYDINLSTGNDAHLYVKRDGGVEQNIDLDLIAYAGAAGNSTMIWVETQGGTTSADVKTGKWTPEQVETLAQIAAWANRTEGVPLQVMPDSKPTSQGIGTHRLGIKHSAGIGAVAGWLVVGGEQWSSATGKECPGDARIAQVPAIVARARQIATPPPAPTVEDPDMADPATIAAIAAQTRDEILYTRDTSTLGANRNLGDKLNQLIFAQAQQSAVIDRLVGLVATQQQMSKDELQAFIHDAITDATVKVTVAVQGSDNQPTA